MWKNNQLAEQAAQARQNYWREQASKARSQGNQVEAAIADRFVREYESFISQVRSTDPNRAA
jgi:hypothetical protein